MNRDPIGYDGGLNLYAYVGGMPTQFVDPMGEQAANKGNPAGTHPTDPGYVYVCWTPIQATDAASHLFLILSDGTLFGDTGFRAGPSGPLDQKPCNLQFEFDGYDRDFVDYVPYSERRKHCRQVYVGGLPHKEISDCFKKMVRCLNKCKVNNSPIWQNPSGKPPAANSNAAVYWIMERCLHKTKFDSGKPPFTKPVPWGWGTAFPKACAEDCK